MCVCGMSVHVLYVRSAFLHIKYDGDISLVYRMILMTAQEWRTEARELVQVAVERLKIAVQWLWSVECNGKLTI